MSEEREQKNAVFQENKQQPPKQQPNAVRPSPSVLAELGIDTIPYESVPLPSNGLLYPSDSSLHKLQTVDIKPMTAKEEDILTSRALIKNGTVITRLIQSSLVDKSIDPRNMLIGDRNSVMIAIRITGYGSKYNVTVMCPKCEKETEHAVNLTQLQIKRLKLEPDEVGVNSFTVTLPKTKAVVKFKFLTGGDEETLGEVAETKKKLKVHEDELVTSRLAAALLSVNGRTDGRILSLFARQCPSQDSYFLRNYIQENEPGVDMQTTFKCENIDCGSIETVRMPINASFFWPDLGK